MVTKVVFSVVIGVVMHSGSLHAMDQPKKRTIEQAEASDIEPSVRLLQCPGAPRKKARTAHRTVPFFPVACMQQYADLQRVVDMDTSAYISVPSHIADNNPCKALEVFVALNSAQKVLSVLDLLPQCIHAQDIWGNTLLHKAVRLNKDWYVQLLCEKGACVYMANSVGDTPISLAARQADGVVLSILNRYLPVPRTMAGY